MIFTQGCRLRCLYCHNPDTRDPNQGQEVTVDDLLAEIQTYRSYMTYSGGGVTISGGEPLLQPEFVHELIRRCRAIGIHTALDTSGYPDFERSKPVLDDVDLVLLDIKSFNPQIYQAVTHVPIEPTLRVAHYLNDIQKPTWVRFVLVPGLTDGIQNMEQLAAFVAQLTCVEKVEILPFHQMGSYKWRQLGYAYALKDTATPTQSEVQQAVEIFQAHGLTVQ